MENLYQENFCEENIWHLAQQPQFKETRNYVLFISNNSKLVHFKNQKSAANSEIVEWDYHVILLSINGKGSYIYDFDSHLPFPTGLKTYLDKTFVTNTESKYAPLFRAIPSDKFIKSFHSDRSHMKDDQGNWLSDPPQWDLIKGSGSEKLLFMDIIDFNYMDIQPIFTLEQLYNMSKT